MDFYLNDIFTNYFKLFTLIIVYEIFISVSVVTESFNNMYEPLGSQVVSHIYFKGRYSYQLYPHTIFLNSSMSNSLLVVRSILLA